MSIVSRILKTLQRDHRILVANCAHEGPIYGSAPNCSRSTPATMPDRRPLIAEAQRAEAVAIELICAPWRRPIALRCIIVDWSARRSRLDARRAAPLGHPRPLAEPGSALAAPDTAAAGEIETARAARPLTAGRIADGSIDDLHTITKTGWASASTRRNHDAPVAIIGGSRNSRSGDGQASRCQGRCLQANAQPIRASFIRSAEHDGLLAPLSSRGRLWEAASFFAGKAAGVWGMG